MFSLTILIPTWDRPGQVNQRLREIDRLWEGSVPVKIQVNPGQYSAKDIDISLYSGSVDVVQNLVNLGLFGSIAMGVQGIVTEWLWILGDDDSLQPDARENIEQALSLAAREGVDALLFNQWNNTLNGPRYTLCRELSSFMKATGFGNPLFISGCMWRTGFLKSNLRLLIEYSFSVASHVLIYIVALASQSSSVLVVDQPLIDYEYAHRWNRLGYLQRVFLLFRHPNVWTHRKDVINFVWPQTRWALQSAAHEQLKNGEATLLDWLRGAWEVVRFQFICAPPAKALGRTLEIGFIILEVYSIPRLFTMVVRRFWKIRTGPISTQPTNPERPLGL